MREDFRCARSLGSEGSDEEGAEEQDEGEGVPDRELRDRVVGRRSPAPVHYLHHLQHPRPYLQALEPQGPSPYPSANLFVLSLFDSVLVLCAGDPSFLVALFLAEFLE